MISEACCRAGAERDEAADIEAALLLSLAENIPGPSGGQDLYFR